ncbi:MAG TPA: sugar transferase [Pseudonocardiaceae bacterium]|nr:sugar transferase [Pseudonocardiaceae bacterium]
MGLGQGDWTTGLDLTGSARNGHSPVAPRPRQPVDDAAVPASPLPTVVPRPRWQLRYARWAAVSDLAAMAGSLGLHKWWGDSSGTEHFRIIFGITLIVLAAGALSLARAWDPAVLGQGSHELNRLLRAHIGLAALLGLIGFALKLPPVRPYLFGVSPLAFALAASARLVMRKVLHRRRRNGSCLHEVLAVGTEEAVAALIARTRRAPHNGWVVTAACTPAGAVTGGGDSILGVPVVGDLDSIAKIALVGQHRVVSVAHAPGWSSQRLHHLAWDLEGTGVELVVDPGLMEIAGPRLHVAAVDGQPLLRLTEPAFTGLPRAAKAVCDRLGAGLLLLIIAPVMIAVTVAIAADGGPVFYRQRRVGRAGKPFSMIKFRSMVVNADQLRAGLEEINEGSGPLFKLRNDPRVTRVGRFLRKYSLDELPQLFNVLGGSMSLVGPRPPLPEEIASYCRSAHRKLLVKPGLTGLWQISGRSDLSWEESVRLDLRYVENWSLTLDLLIIWKTIGTVMKGTGAY